MFFVKQLSLNKGTHNGDMKITQIKYSLDIIYSLNIFFQIYEKYKITENISI